MENDFLLRAVINDEAEMLIFPSVLLPKRYQSMLLLKILPVLIDLCITSDLLSLSSIKFKTSQLCLVLFLWDNW
jgi:ABC-type cobalamin transport system permease subunit